MREILFRGKPLGNLHGEFIYGSLGVIDTDLCAIYHCFEFKDDEMQLVDNGTVGQYTGLTDNNGVAIFEGDIIRIYGDENNPDTKMIDYNALVVFKRGGFCAVDGTEENHSFSRPIFNSYLKCKVVGNTYDNPELLEE